MLKVNQIIFKRIFVVSILALFLISMIFFAFPGKVYANGGTTYYVATTGSDDTGDGTEGNPYETIQKAISIATSGSTIIVTVGEYDVPQILFDKSLTITGANPSDRPVLYLSQDCIGGSGTQSGWFRIDGAYTVNLSNLVLDGDKHGKKTSYAIGVRNGGTGTFENNVIRDISMDGSHGCGISTRCNITVQNNTFQNIERIGISVNYNTTTLDCLIKNNTFIGNGVGYEMCEYGIEVDYGGSATVEGNTVYNYYGVASDGSESAAIYINSFSYSTYGHSKANVKNNIIYNSAAGLFIGNAYSGHEGDQTEVTATGNKIYNNEYGIGIEYAKSLTANNNDIYSNTYGIYSWNNVVVDATNNWWGDASGPYHATSNPSGTGNAVSDKVNFVPWLTNPVGYVPPAPPRPLTPEEQAALDLSIEKQVAVYGASNVGFAKTLYDNILGRAADEEGLNAWVTALNEGRITLKDLVFGFVFSKELEPVVSPAGPEEFITFLYKNVLNREPDPDGFNNWLTHMQNGMTKEEVLLHFVDSEEFNKICEMFGL